MKRLHNYDGVDSFRMIAAFLALAAHTYPLSSISADLNYVLIHVFARIVVPFFMMTTGYFLLPKYFEQDKQDEQVEQLKQSREPLYRFIKKIGVLYIGATLLYLPASIYAGFYSGGNALQAFIRNFLIDGTFYHLWYLPAKIVGVFLVYALSLKCSLRTTFSVSVVLYIFGMLGDNYYHLIANVQFLQSTYESAFQIFSYTRNGLFYAPVFLTMGAMIAKQEKPFCDRANIIGFIVCMLLMLIESTLLQRFGAPRHTSMYIMLLPCSFFLFGFLRSKQGKRSHFMRTASMWIFILHPLLIIVTRGGARIFGLTDILVGNSVVFFFCVSALSLTCAVLISKREVIYSRLATVLQYLFRRKKLHRQ